MNNSDLEKIETLNNQSKAAFEIDHWGREVFNNCDRNNEHSAIDLNVEPTTEYNGEYVPFTVEGVK